jgi:DNA helicase-4
LEKGLKRYYKYIVIDEFQDISYNRYKLIKIIRDSCNSKIFAVGDDYQSIYKFAGSNIKLITNFKKYFGFTRIIKINNTYRYSQELIMVSNKFITKNRRQIKKKIVSSKHNCKPVKIIYYYKNMGIKLKKLLEMVDKNIMILSRNNFDINYIIDEDLKYEDNKIKFNNKEYAFRSVHKSKGLEEDNIIILNLVDSTFGFPNKKEDKILNILLPKDKYLYEEERRLFYVALTRTRNYVYLFVSKDKPSSFVKELLRNNKKYIEVLNL